MTSLQHCAECDRPLDQDDGPFCGDCAERQERLDE